MTIVIYRLDDDTFYLGRISNSGEIVWDFNNPYSSGWLERWGYPTDIKVGEIYRLES
ncbi:MAG: hypothetical protein N3E38_02785 [Candidatus Aenigmarchaeota archaeon]|nr:hypothetical protein [Candidatus Aenigmarchaeota archaeon]MCX8179631.1 hypothetical protein [Candidatus Aenigmarchaeota archaeon]